MSDIASHCLRTVRGCATSEQYTEAHERIVKAMTECMVAKVAWQKICLAYQGDTKPCATACLHCHRIETALSQ